MYGFPFLMAMLIARAGISSLDAFKAWGDASQFRRVGPRLPAKICDYVIKPGCPILMMKGRGRSRGMWL